MQAAHVLALVTTGNPIGAATYVCYLFWTLRHPDLHAAPETLEDSFPFSVKAAFRLAPSAAPFP